jgi:hypothetical protein
MGHGIDGLFVPVLAEHHEPDGTPVGQAACIYERAWRRLHAGWRQSADQAQR